MELKIAKGKKALMDRIVSKLHATRPRNEVAGTFEVSRTTKEIMSKVKYTLLTGIKAFDDITGGLPFGRITELYGLEGSGKTGMAIRAAIRAQQRHIYERVKEGMGPTTYQRIPEDSDVTVLYVDNEQSLDDDEKTALDDEYNPNATPTKIDAVVVRCDTVDQLFKAIDNTIEMIKDYEEESGRTQFVVVVVDTVASTSSKEEMTAEWGKVDYARQPKQLREGFRKMTRVINRQNVCMICLNQVSERYDAAQYKGPKSSTPQDEDFSTFGGRALKYYASLRVFMYKMRTKLVLIPKTQFASGYIIGFKTTKNRVLKPMREGRLTLLLGKGFRDQYSILETLLHLKFAEMGDKGDIRFRFRSNKITTTTFGSKASSLEDEDDNGGREVDPRIDYRAQWPAFYQAHKEDFDKMWQAAMDYIFTVESSNSVDENLIEDDDESEIALTEEA